MVDVSEWARRRRNRFGGESAAEGAFREVVARVFPFDIDTKACSSSSSDESSVGRRDPTFVGAFGISMNGIGDGAPLAATGTEGRIGVELVRCRGRVEVMVDARVGVADPF